MTGQVWGTNSAAFASYRDARPDNRVQPLFPPTLPPSPPPAPVSEPPVPPPVADTQPMPVAEAAPAPPPAAQPAPPPTIPAPPTMTDPIVPQPTPGAAFVSIPDLAGPNYIRFCETLHAALRPKTYLELGTGRGDMLRLANCRSISVDPAATIMAEAIEGKPACFLFRQDSDSFFRENDPAQLLGSPIDLAFLDGPRLFERMLREFAATERHCRRNSVILLHDCIPTDSHIARRSQPDETTAHHSEHPSWWAGDVWKAAALILRYRPDLRVYAFNTPPTGLIAITNLDPTSTLIEDHYFALLNDAETTLSTPNTMLNFFSQLDARTAEDYNSIEKLAELFAI